MRSTLIGGGEILQNNLNRKQNRVRVFEIARVFSKGSDGQFVQNERIGGLVRRGHAEQWGENAQRGFYDIKADVENLLKTKQLSSSKPNIPLYILAAPPISFQTTKLSALSANCIRNGCKIRLAASAAGI